MEKLIPKARIKCLAKIVRLSERGHKLRRPEADYLENGVYELRIGLQGVNYRILYFFYDQKIAVLSHGITKRRKVPDKEIQRAARYMEMFKKNPEKHTYFKEAGNRD